MIKLHKNINNRYDLALLNSYIYMVFYEIFLMNIYVRELPWRPICLYYMVIRNYVWYLSMYYNEEGHCQSMGVVLWVPTLLWMMSQTPYLSSKGAHLQEGKRLTIYHIHWREDKCYFITILCLLVDFCGLVEAIWVHR